MKTNTLSGSMMSCIELCCNIFRWHNIRKAPLSKSSMQFVQGLPVGADRGSIAHILLMGSFYIMPLTSKKLEGHVAFGSFICLFVHPFGTFCIEIGC